MKHNFIERFSVIHREGIKQQFWNELIRYRVWISFNREKWRNSLFVTNFPESCPRLLFLVAENTETCQGMIESGNVTDGPENWGTWKDRENNKAGRVKVPGRLDKSHFLIALSPNQQPLTISARIKTHMAECFDCVLGAGSRERVNIRFTGKKDDYNKYPIVILRVNAPSKQFVREEYKRMEKY